MENSIGLFGQIKLIFKGIIKPKYFNRLAGQSKSKLVAHILFVTLIATIIYWGIQVLVMNMPNGIIGQADSLLKTLPQLEYSNKTLWAEQEYHKYNEEMTRHVVIDTSVDSPDKAYKDLAYIKTDWSNGRMSLIFNAKSVNIIMPFGQWVTISYDKLESMLFLSNSINNSNIVNEYKLTIYKLAGIVAVASYPVFAVIAMISGMMVTMIGFGLVKIFKLQYSFKELINVGWFITGVTGFIKVILNAQPIPINIIWINVIFILASGAYIFFALTGAQEDIGPSSSIVFNKPGSKKFSDEPLSADPFDRKDRRREERFNNTRSQEVKQVEAAPVQAAPVYSEPVYEQTATPVYEEPVYEQVQTPVYEEPVYEQVQTPVYEEPVYEQVQTPVYEEPVYEQVQTPVYEEPVYTQTTTYESAVVKEEPSIPKFTNTSSSGSSIIKSDLTYGVGYSSSSSGKKSKPKYDRPITAPDSYNGAYYGSSDEDGYSNSFGSGTLLDRGGLYGKTLGAPTGSVEANPFSNVINASAQRNSSSYDTTTTTTVNTESSSSGLSFTTKSGNQPFSTSTTFQTHTPGKTINHYDKSGVSSKPYTKKGSSKPISRYTADDFAAWERENYAEEFNKPRGGFGNNI